MTKPRLLVPLTIQFSVRYLLRTGLLERLREFSTPIVLPSWKDSALRSEIEQLGIEVLYLPDTRYGPSYIKVRRQIDTWHYERLGSPTTAIAQYRKNIDLSMRLRLIKQLRELRNRAYLHIPGYVRRLHEQERTLLEVDTNIREFKDFVRSLRGDALLSLTPFHRQEELLVRAAAEERLKMCASILSFDNVTVRGWIGALFDSYLVWNRHSLEQLRRGYPEAHARRIVVVGAPQFDFYWKPEFCWSESDWRTRMQLPPHRPIVLYGAGPPTIVRHEPHIVMQLDAAIERGEIPERPLILLRRHPADNSERWASVLRDAKHLVFDEPWKTGDDPKYSNIGDQDIAKLVSTLKHSAVHVNVASTMTVDGSVFDRPQVGPAYDDRPGHKYDRMMHQLYAHEHFLPITASGGLEIVCDERSLVRAVVGGLRQPGIRAEGRKKLVSEIISFTDGQATGRVVNEIARLLRS